MNKKMLRCIMINQEISVNELVKELLIKYNVSMNRSTFYRKISGTSEFDRKEINAISKVLNLSSTQIIHIFFE